MSRLSQDSREMRSWNFHQVVVEDMPEVPSWTFPWVEIKVGIAKVNLSMPITFKELDSMKVRVWVLVLGRITLVVAMHRSFNLIKSCTGNWTGVFQLKLFEHWHLFWAGGLGCLSVHSASRRHPNQFRLGCRIYHFLKVFISISLCDSGGNYTVWLLQG